MKRLTAILLILLSAIAIQFGCKAVGSNRKISVVCTIFPQYDWVRQILGDTADRMDITLLLHNRIDLHNYQPSVDDIIQISACDLFIHVGGESDGWVNDVLKKKTNKNMIVINLLGILGSAAKSEEIMEGMEKKEHEDNDEAEYDEHVWLSLKNAQKFCAAIADALASLDADNAQVYRDNLRTYIEKLSVLDAEYQTTVDTYRPITLLFGDRFPFRYLADDYGLRYYAAFPGCSAETEASFETIIFLAGKMDALKLINIMVTESADRSIARTIRDNTAGKNQQILALDSMQSVTGDDIANGAAYLSIMEHNLSVLKEALN
ncbi:MAG: metal ABC transporter substrate-binding protein [Spirochaetota bacterium]|jgi:zinc transport system substrate-binding protein|nr:metal ABC transporter substrate-binding protein [Spirochaetota bacterium]